MPYVNPIWLEGRRRYWERHDWQRYLTPAGLAEHQRAEEEAKLAARRKAEAAEQEEMRETLLWLRRELAEVKFALAFRRIFHKYRADQPRVPKAIRMAGSGPAVKPRRVTDQYSRKHLPKPSCWLRRGLAHLSPKFRSPEGGAAFTISA